MMPKYIDRELALSMPFANGHYDHENANEHYIFGCETYKEWLETLPTTDAVEVIRCRDCKHRHQTTCPFLIANTYRTSDYDDYCSRGERKRGIK